MNAPILAPIPKLFKNDLTGDTFKKCVSCECRLEEEPQGYIIEKAIKPYLGFKSYSTVFEYAMCFSCVETMRNELSEESKTKVEAYFLEKANFNSRPEVLEGEEPQVEDWLNNCLVYNSEVNDLGECQIMAHCVGDEMIYHQFPYMISGQVSDDMLGLLSAKSKSDLDGFKDRVTGGPSEFMKLLEKKTMFV